MLLFLANFVFIEELEKSNDELPRAPDADSAVYVPLMTAQRTVANLQEPTYSLVCQSLTHFPDYFHLPRREVIAFLKKLILLFCKYHTTPAAVLTHNFS